MSYNLLKGKKGIIFGALNEMSIAWKVAEKCLEEGAEIVLTNTELSIRMGQIKDFAEKNNVPLIPADATSEEDLERLFKEAMELLGGKIDFILHSVAMSLNVRKKRPYAAQRTMFEYNDMADAKAMLESIARSFGYIYGREKRVRVNTISQSPTVTTAGSGIKGFDSLIDFAERMSPLGNASADECANYCITLFSDLTRKVTMQNLFHDGGFSSMGMSYRAMHQYNKSFENGETK